MDAYLISSPPLAFILSAEGQGEGDMVMPKS